MSKTYHSGNVEFGFGLVNTNKWGFKVKDGAKAHVLLTACKGLTVAHKIANLINGSFKRSGCIDNLCRANIARLNK